MEAAVLTEQIETHDREIRAQIARRFQDGEDCYHDMVVQLLERGVAPDKFSHYILAGVRRGVQESATKAARRAELGGLFVRGFDAPAEVSLARARRARTPSPLCQKKLHPMTDDNLYFFGNGTRTCRACFRERINTWRQRRKHAKL